MYIYVDEDKASFSLHYLHNGIIDTCKSMGIYTSHCINYCLNYLAVEKKFNSINYTG